MKLYIEALLVLAVAIAAGAMVLKYNDAIDDASTARNETSVIANAMQKQQFEFALLQSRYDAVDAALKEKQSNEELVRRALYRFERKIGDLRASDPVVRDWADGPIPDAVLGVLRDDPTNSGQGSGVHLPAAEPDSAHADAKPRPAGGTPKR